MAILYQSIKQFGRSLIFAESNRNLSLSATAYLREIIKKKEDKVLTIEGVKVPHKQEHLLLKFNSKACPLCAAGVNVKHTDVLILNQFVRSNGGVLPRRITGLCKVQQKRISVLVTMAQKAGLLPSKSIERENKRGPAWKRYNTYYDENTIQYKYKR
ncbi:28S ribosomal protein S18a, mitochondrial [Solenopsis invicta]|uniref:28S ribosomal protein S18a, mitochondrial n=1 Tax=Solenopsis invicta TaxID=13686 RepID=UPI000595C476|nr:28S ribosomal protein S18a, mitochondrial [Solenopsis invicta]